MNDAIAMMPTFAREGQLARGSHIELCTETDKSMNCGGALCNKCSHGSFVAQSRTRNDGVLEMLIS